MDSVVMADSPTPPDPIREFLDGRRRLLDGLSDSALHDCASSVRSRQRADGGYAGRGDRSDLYYTFFALAGLTFLGKSLDVERTKEYLSTFGDGESLDLVHLCCLIRCHNLLAMHGAPGWAAGRIGRFVQARRQKPALDSLSNHAATATRVYDLFLAVQTGRELGVDPVSKGQVHSALQASRHTDGGYSDPTATESTTTVTAAGVWLGRWLDGTGFQATSNWFASVASRDGGFRASPNAPAADLLSTASALQAVRWLGTDVSHHAKSTLDFVESCWRDDGSFGPAPSALAGDVEYTFYGLLSLSNLLV